MQCPECEKNLLCSFIGSEGIQPNELFQCDNCNVDLSVEIDEGTF
jgi:hypothetical protein